MDSVTISTTRIGDAYPVFIIAEIGINHNGNTNLAKRMILSAKDCGANCVKFQTFRASQVVTPSAPKANYQLEVTDKNESQLEMLKKVELDYDDHLELKKYADNLDMIFLSTPYNDKDVDLLEDLNVDGYKIASGQIVETPFLEKIARKQKPIFLSTGMATLAEVDNAVQVIKSCGNQQILLLQCTTNYPSALSDANLNVIPTMKRAFKLPIGYSDHTMGNETAIAAVALGACLVEKHFTLDKSMEGPDHACSATPEDFFQLVRSVRSVEQAMGTGVKYPSDAEIRNALGMRRSITAACNIKQGDVIRESMLTFKRPATGLDPTYHPVIIGNIASRDIPKDELIALEMIHWIKK